MALNCRGIREDYQSNCNTFKRNFYDKLNIYNTGGGDKYKTRGANKLLYIDDIKGVSEYGKKTYDNLREDMDEVKKLLKYLRPCHNGRMSYRLNCTTEGGDMSHYKMERVYENTKSKYARWVKSQLKRDTMADRNSQLELKVELISVENGDLNFQEQFDESEGVITTLENKQREMEDDVILGINTDNMEDLISIKKQLKEKREIHKFLEEKEAVRQEILHNNIAKLEKKQFHIQEQRKMIEDEWEKMQEDIFSYSPLLKNSITRIEDNVSIDFVRGGFTMTLEDFSTVFYLNGMTSKILYSFLVLCKFNHQKNLGLDVKHFVDNIKRISQHDFLMLCIDLPMMLDLRYSLLVSNITEDQLRNLNFAAKMDVCLFTILCSQSEDKKFGNVIMKVSRMISKSELDKREFNLFMSETTRLFRKELGRHNIIDIISKGLIDTMAIMSERHSTSVVDNLLEMETLPDDFEYPVNMGKDVMQIRVGGYDLCIPMDIELDYGDNELILPKGPYIHISNSTRMFHVPRYGLSPFEKVEDRTGDYFPGCNDANSSRLRISDGWGPMCILRSMFEDDEPVFIRVNVVYDALFDTM